MKKKKNIINIAIVIVVVLMILVVNYNNGREETEKNQEQIESMSKNIDVILSGSEKKEDKASDILNLFMEEKNNAVLNDHELNLVINNYEAMIIENMLDSDYESLSQYSYKLKFINVLHIISGYQLRPWQHIISVDINEQNVNVMTNTKNYNIEGKAMYLSDLSIGKVPTYFDFDAWLSLLEDVLSKEYPDQYSTRGNITNGFKIIEKWTSNEFTIQLLNVYFGAYSYNNAGYKPAGDEYKVVDGLTIFVMLINEENDVIDLGNLYNFGDKYSLNDGVDYLNKTYGKAKQSDLAFIDDWLDSRVSNPISGQSKLTRASVLDDIKDHITVKLENA